AARRSRGRADDDRWGVLCIPPAKQGCSNRDRNAEARMATSLAQRSLAQQARCSDPCPTAGVCSTQRQAPDHSVALMNPTLRRFTGNVPVAAFARRMQDRVNKAIASAVKHFELFGTRGVLRRALISVPGVNTEFKVPIPNSPHSVILRLGTSDVAAFEHVFVHQEYDISIVGAPSIIVDAGANVGMSAVYFSLRYPCAQVLAVEP